VEAGEDVGNKLLVINKSLARICHLICEPLHFALVAGRRHVPFLRCGEGHAGGLDRHPNLSGEVARIHLDEDVMRQRGQQVMENLLVMRLPRHVHRVGTCSVLVALLSTVLAGSLMVPST
jgi:hypothetical protein